MNIGELINLGLTKKKMSQKELANLVGVNPPAVTKWISGKNSPPADKLIKIISLLNLTEEFFPERKQELEKLDKETNQINTRLEKLESLFEQDAHENNKRKIQALEAENAMLRAAIGDFDRQELIESMHLLRSFDYDALREASNLIEEFGSAILKKAAKNLTRKKVKQA